MDTSMNKLYGVSDVLVPYQFPDKSKFNGLITVTEAPGQEEEEQQLPLVGTSGEKYDQWLKKHKISRSHIIVANTFRYRPEGNKVIHFFCSDNVAKEQAIDVCLDKPKFNSRRLIKHFYPELEYLIDTIVENKPKVVMSMGAIATWALLDLENIGALQGNEIKKTFIHSKTGKKFTTLVLPSYHPSSVLYTNNQTLPSIMKVFHNAKQHLGI